MKKLFEFLKQKKENQTVEDEAEERLKNIVDEAETLKRQVEDKLRLIQGTIIIINTFTIISFSIFTIRIMNYENYTSGILQ